jgi:hypothetical protein
MVAVTYGVAGGRAAETVAPGKTWLARFMDALSESRVQQARREIRLHTGLLPYSLDERGNRLVKTGVNDMPFGV